MRINREVTRRFRLMILVLLAGLVLLAAGCRKVENSVPEEARALSQEEVMAAFAEQGLMLQKGEDIPGSIFQLELNGRKPQLYSLNGVELSLYPFASAEERAAGWKSFGDQTAAADLIPYKEYQEGAYLMFYIHGEAAAEGQKWNEKLNKQMKAAVQGLITAEQDVSF